MSNSNEMQKEFMLRYRIEDVHVEYQHKYDRLPYYQMSGTEPYSFSYDTVKMATVKLPMDMLEQIMYDLEMKSDEVHIRINNPAALDAYQKYRMLVELLK